MTEELPKETFLVLNRLVRSIAMFPTIRSERDQFMIDAMNGAVVEIKRLLQLLPDEAKQ